MVGVAIAGGAVIGAGASIASGAMQSSAAEDAAETQAEAAGRSVAEQRRQFDITRQDLAPFRRTGTRALDMLGSLFLPQSADYFHQQYLDAWARMHALQEAGAYPSEEAEAVQRDINRSYADWQAAQRREEADTGTGREDAMTAFVESPSYQFRFNEGLRALDRSAAARGGLRGGGYGRELTRFGQGLASTEFGNYANRLAALAGAGQSAVNTGAALGAQTARGIGNTLMSGAQLQGNALQDAATARASGYAGAANAVNSGVSNYAFYNALARPRGAGGYSMIPVA